MPMGAAITGLGVVTALGATAAQTWAALERGENGIRPIERFDASELGSQLGATVQGELAESANRPAAYAIAAGREALADAGVSAGRARTALVLGTSLGSHRTVLAALADTIASALGVEGPRIIISTACSSSTHAVGLARDLLRAGEADVVLAGGTDELTPELLAGFSALRVVSRQRCAPFSEPVGTSLGEGAGFVVVEGGQAALARGRSPHAWLRGYALTADAHHATSPDPAGTGVKRAISGALEDAGLPPESIEYVNAHGTGTAANDPAETHAILTVLRRDGRQPWISSSKSFLGHAQGAAGVLELVMTILGMEKGLLPCTMSFAGPRPRCPVDPVAGTVPRPGAFSCALSLNAAFGGANAAVVVSRHPSRAPSTGSPQRVVVAGASLVGPSGLSLADALTAQLPLSGPAPPLAIECVVRGVDPRGVDRATCLLAAAVKQALDASGLELAQLNRDRIGLFVGQTRVALEAEREFGRSIEQRGLARLSAPAFAKMVLNAAASAVTRMFGLRGALTAISTGSSSGLCAVALAADYLTNRSDTDALVVAGVSEMEPEADVGAEGACALVLTTQHCLDAWAEVRGWTVGTAMDRTELKLRALERAGVTRTHDAAMIAASEVSTDEGGLSGAVACAVAAEQVRSRQVENVVAVDNRASTAVGVVLTAPAAAKGGVA